MHWKRPSLQVQMRGCQEVLSSANLYGIPFSLNSCRGSRNSKDGRIALIIPVKLLKLLKRLSGHSDNEPSARSVGSVPLEAGDLEIDPYNPFPEPVEVALTDVFDLHSISPREVETAVRRYLEDAQNSGFKTVRIIHGKGTGFQRNTVHRILAETPFVEHFGDAHPHSGGWGATIATLKSHVNIIGWKPYGKL